jgi:hypothetical protein
LPRIRESTGALSLAMPFNQWRNSVEQLRFLIRLTKIIIDAQLDRSRSMLLAYA